MQSPELLKAKCFEFKSKLHYHKSVLIAEYAEIVGYNIDDVKLLWTDLDLFLDNFHILYENTHRITQEQKYLYQQWEPKSELLYLPWGKVLICSPSNSVIPLLPIFILSFCSTGNSIILSPSRKVSKIAYLIFEIANEIFSDIGWDITFYSTGGASAIKEFVNNKSIDLLYFQGSSKNRESVYQNCVNNGIELIYEGEGNQISIVEKIDDSRIKSVVETIFNAKKLCNGQLCTTPNVLFIDYSIKSFFCEHYEALGGKTRSFDFENRESLKNAINSEIFSTELQLCSYTDIDSVISFLKENYLYGLQVSIFSDNSPRIKEKILTKLHIGRITINMNPTFQNSLLPWGGYKKSGFSNVVNFIQKGLKSVIVEEND